MLPRPDDHLSTSFNLYKLVFSEPSPPNITIYPMDGQMIVSGSNANLSCEASGVPVPKILWFKNGSRIPNSSVKDGKGFSVMALESVRPNDRGHYWCEANSTEGSVQSPAVVITGIKPK